MEEDFKALGLIPNDDGYNALVKDLTADIGQHNSLMAPLRKLEEDKNAELEAVKNATREAMKVRKSGNIQQASDLEKKRDEMIKKAKGLGYGQDAEDAATEVEGEQTEDAEGMSEAAEQSKEEKYAEAYRNFKTYSFDSEEDYKKYRKYRRYAYSVYPYAVEAVRIFKEVEAVTNDVRKNQKRKYIKTLQEDLSEKFEEPLKKLTKTQGMILIKMIERELDVPMYDLVRDLRGGWTATYWSVLGSFYGHHLKEGYTRGKDPMLDVVLDDLNLTYGQKKQ
jgi:hypothetical protein